MKERKVEDLTYNKNEPMIVDCGLVYMNMFQYWSFFSDNEEELIYQIGGPKQYVWSFINLSSKDIIVSRAEEGEEGRRGRMGEKMGVKEGIMNWNLIPCMYEFVDRKSVV